jgi:hypothetical protein
LLEEIDESTEAECSAMVATTLLVVVTGASADVVVVAGTSFSVMVDSSFVSSLVSVVVDYRVVGSTGKSSLSLSLNGDSEMSVRVL